jgi:excinuclease ABC subunit A
MDVPVPLAALVGVCGPSGSGKSTLVIDTLGRALAPRRQTTSVAHERIDPGEHDGIDGAPSRALVVDQSRYGIRTPVHFLGLTRALETLYAESEDARALGLTAADLGRRCSVCGGCGVVTVDMGFLPDVSSPCEACDGTGHLAEAWEVRLRGVALPEVFSRTFAEVSDLFGDAESLRPGLDAVRAVGLEYLVLRQPSQALSGGETQRLKIAHELGRRVHDPSLYILDEPTVGLHLEDVAQLIRVFDSLVDRGHSVLVVEHHPHLLAACDWLLELGPAGGPAGGRLIAAGTPEELAAGTTPIASHLRAVLEPAP